MKKALSILLSLCMLLSLTAGIDFSAYALDSDYILSRREEGYNYETGAYVYSYGIGGYTGSETILNIPSVIDGKTITRIDSIANKSVISITIPETVTYINGYAFSGCENLVSIDLGTNTTTINYHAFSGLKNLKSVKFGNKLKSIGDYAFENCSNLSSITLPESVETIGADCFAGCSRLTALKIPDSVTELGSYFINKCNNLVSLDIGDGVSTINTLGSSSVQTINLGKNVSALFDGSSSYSDDEGFEGDDVFKGNPNLKRITVDSENTHFSADDYALYNYDKTAVYKGFCGSNNSVLTIPNTVISIKNTAFRNCINIKEAYIPDSVLAIGVSAFYGCTSLETVRIGNGLSRIPNYCFSNCTNLKNVDFGTSVNTIGVRAFSYCDNLNSLVLPKNIDSVEGGFFNKNYNDKEKIAFLFFLNKDCVLNGYINDNSNIYICSSSGGAVENYCKKYNYKFVDVDKYDCEKDKHYYVEKIITRNTCTQEGESSYTCVFCNDTYNAVTPAKGHTVVTDKAIPATFKTSGKTQGSHCSVCGEVFVERKTVQMLGSPKLSKVTKAKKAFTAKWAKFNVDGYQIRYSLKKNMKNSKTVKAGKTAVSKRVKKLKSNKTYYVQIRGYKTINKKKVYSNWSAKKKVKTK